MKQITIKKEELIPSSYSDIFFTKDNLRLVKIMPYDEYQRVKKTLKYLNDHKDKLPPLAYYDLEGELPDKTYYISRPHYKNATTSSLLSNQNTPQKTKIEILKQIGLVITQISSLYKDLGICYGELDESSILYNGSALPIDIETINTKVNPTSASAQLYYSPWVKEFKKYNAKMEEIPATPDTDYYSLIMLCLKVISNSKEVFLLNPQIYMKYLDFLSDLGFDSKLLESFKSIYEEKPTINPTPFIETIPLNIEKASYINFSKKKN